MSNENPNAPRYKLLEVNKDDFKSSIPPHLLAKLSDSERYMCETMSRLENQNNWMVNALLQVNKDVVDCDRRITEGGNQLTAITDWKATISGKWAVVGATSLVLLSVGAKFMFDALLSLFKGGGAAPHP